MTKKSTSWVTIPEEKNNVSVSSQKPAKGTELIPVKNKIFWASAFVFMVIIVAVLLLPKQTVSVLQGNLFAQSGIEGAEDVDLGVQPLNVIPASGGEDVSEDQESVADSEESTGDSEETEEQPEVQDKTVVGANTEAVTIQVEPVTVSVEPVVEPAVDIPSPGEEEESDTGEPVEVQVEIPATADESENSDIKEELDANRKLLEDLTKQIAEFQEKDKQNNKALQDLTEIVKDDSLHPASDTNNSVETTVLIGQTHQEQPLVSDAGYRINTHTVKMTPQEALQENKIRMETGQQALTSASVTSSSGSSYQSYNSQLSQAQGTPESGPKESMMIAFIVTFIALLGWKFFRLMIKD